MKVILIMSQKHRIISMPLMLHSSRCFSEALISLFICHHPNKHVLEFMSSKIIGMPYRDMRN